LGRWLRSWGSAVAGGARSTGGRRRAVTPPQEGGGDATGGPRGQRHRQDRSLYSLPRTRTQRDAIRGVAPPWRRCLGPPAASRSRRPVPSPTQTTQERGRATPGKYVLVNPDRVNWGGGGRRRRILLGRSPWMSRADIQVGQRGGQARRGETLTARPQHDQLTTADGRRRSARPAVTTLAFRDYLSN
jgi:hypothetical protein